MIYQTVTYFPELEKPDMKLLFNRIIENSKQKDWEYAVKEWKYYDGKGRNFILEDTQCICSKVIKYTHYIDNATTGTSLILGRCCIKKFIPVYCKDCNEQLKDIKTRIASNNLICPACSRKKKQEKIKMGCYVYFSKDIYRLQTFKSLLRNEKFLTMIANKTQYLSNSDKAFLKYLDLMGYEII